VAEIARNEIEKPAGGEERQRPLQRLEDRDGAKPFLQAALQR
jgi:hypothetical protein